MNKSKDSADKQPKLIRTRYAPSPTGSLHVGGARTALFNYLFAKHHNGKFILRIEDTDTERNIEGSDTEQETSLKGLGIFPDESFTNPGNFGPYRQSQKETRYLEIAEQLVQEKKAYYCFCSAEELVEARETAIKNNQSPIYLKKCCYLSQEEINDKLNQQIPYTIRLKGDIKEEYSWDDMIRNKIVVPSSALGDFIVIRSNKKATYNFAVVIDDYDMKINHILRGEEHISNTPYQLAVYHALNWEQNIPKFGHISMIVDKDKQKLSKRNGKPYHFISYFLSRGYPPEALFNFLALLSWSYGEEEIFTISEIIKLFNVKNISSSSTVFDLEKLNWLSHKYFQNMNDDYYLNFIHVFFDFDFKENEDKKNFFALLNKTRISYACQLNELSKDFFQVRNLTFSQIELLKNHKELLIITLDHFPEPSEEWDLTTIRNYLKQLMELSSLKGKSFFKPLRIAFSFQEDGFAIPDLLFLLGRNKSLENLKISINSIN